MVTRKCEICNGTEEQNQFVQTYGEWFHEDCLDDAIADAEIQEQEHREMMRHHGEYDERPSGMTEMQQIVADQSDAGWEY